MMTTLAAMPQSSDDPEQHLMVAVRSGVDGSVEALVGRFQDELVGFFYHQCWDQGVAEELAQDVFVNAYRARERWVPSARVRTWLYRIAHNRWIDHLRRQRPHRSLSDIAVDDLEAPMQSLAMDGSVRERLQAAVAALPDGQRVVVGLVVDGQLPYAEVARVLAIPEGTVKSRMFHAVRQLRTALGDLWEEVQP